MLWQLAILFALPPLFDQAARLLGIPVPGALLALAAALATFAMRGGVPASFDAVARPLTGLLGLYLVAPGVGVIVHLRELAREWPALLALLVCGAAINLAVTALAMRLALGVRGPRGARDAGDALGAPTC